MAALQRAATQQQPRQPAAQAQPAPKTAQPTPPAMALQQACGNRAVGAWALRLALAEPPVIQREAIPGAPAQAACNADQTAYIDTALTDARSWRRSVLTWFEAYRSDLVRPTPVAGQYRPVGGRLLGKLRLLNRHFRIGAAISDRGSVFPHSASERVTARDLENFGSATYDIRGRFNSVELASLAYQCQAVPDPSLRDRAAWGSSVPGSGEITIYTNALDPQAPEVKAGVALHEAFHATFRDFSGDSYSNRAGYPGASPLTNADSYATFASIVATGRSYRSFARFLMPAIQLRGVPAPNLAAFAQAKPLVSQPGDEYEREAEQVAGHILRTPADAKAGDRPALGRIAMRTATGGASAATAQIPAGGGRPLDPATRSFFEPRFGADFSRVRVHDDPAAAQAAREINARAFTYGNRIYFGAGEHRPQSHEGRRLLAHELAHVVQQTVTRRANPMINRAVTVAESDTSLRITQQPRLDLRVQNLLGKWRARPETPTAIEFTAMARANCGRGESVAGYELGIVQMQTRNVNNVRYQGSTPTEGSVWIRCDFPAVFPPGPCHDSPWGTIRPGHSGALFWSQSSPVRCGQTLTLTHRDWPQDMYDTVIQNPLTRRPNYLKEIHMAFDFTTALMFKRPDNSLQTLRWARWNLGWDYTFNTPASGQSAVQRGLATTGTLEFAVPMAAPPELPTRYALPAKNCNTLTYEASNNPARIQPSRTW